MAAGRVAAEHVACARRPRPRPEIAVDIARTVALSVNSVLLEQARAAAYRARLDFLAADLVDGDCDAAVRRVQAADARVARLETGLEMRRHPRTAGTPVRRGGR
jgi:hypothetical protein